MTPLILKHTHLVELNDASSNLISMCRTFAVHSSPSLQSLTGDRWEQNTRVKFSQKPALNRRSTFGRSFFEGQIQVMNDSQCKIVTFYALYMP